MPTLSVDKNVLYNKIGREFSDEEFDELCFQYGIELDDIELEEGQVKFKIDLPANRSDLLCVEGLARCLRVFLSMGPAPHYSLYDSGIHVEVDPKLADVRPYVVCAVLKGIQFTQASFDSFIDLQERLHQNICRKRSLVSVGTHDLDTMSPPVRYVARTPGEIRFKTLTSECELDGTQIMDSYRSDKKFKEYVQIIDGFSRYPLITDTKNILSLPPIINSDHSRLTLSTRNVFIEATATDLTKAKIVVDTIVTNFSEYCDAPFQIGTVKVVHPDGSVNVQPELPVRRFELSSQFLNTRIGIKFSCAQYCDILLRMGYRTKQLSDQVLMAETPRDRFDIIHPFDVVEDTAIAYGFDNVPKTPLSSFTVASTTTLNRFTDLLRHEAVRMGYTEAFSFILCSVADLTTRLNRDCDNFVKIQTTYEHNCARNSLVPGLLKTLATNRSHTLPMKLFEVSDVVVTDENFANGARNVRHLCLLFCGTNSGFELIHGSLDIIMGALKIPAHFDTSGDVSFRLVETDDPSFFPERCCSVQVKGIDVGRMGIVHPNILKNFEVHQGLCSLLELNVEVLLQFFND